MEMPDVITVWGNGKLHCRDESKSKEPIHSKSRIEKYHHSRIVEAIKHENEQLKATHCETMRKLEKTKDALRFYGDESTYKKGFEVWVNAGVVDTAPEIETDKGHRARTALGEIE